MRPEIIPYEPKFLVTLPKLAEVGTAWNGIDRILYDIVNRFDIPQHAALEFGVQFGYSTTALANVFDQVRGVDTFAGDVHAGFFGDHFEETKAKLKPWPNIELIQARYEDYCLFDDLGQYDLIHIDMDHTYQNTYESAAWAVRHSPVVILHDTEAFPDVKYAVQDIAQDYGRKFYNYEPCHGLGILVK